MSGASSTSKPTLLPPACYYHSAPSLIAPGPKCLSLDTQHRHPHLPYCGTHYTSRDNRLSLHRSIATHPILSLQYTHSYTAATGSSTPPHQPVWEPECRPAVACLLDDLRHHALRQLHITPLAWLLPPSRCPHAFRAGAKPSTRGEER